MTDPVISFFISGRDTQMYPHSELWSLPLQGEGAGAPDNYMPPSLRPVLVGDFLEASRSFLGQDHFHGLYYGIFQLSDLPHDQILITDIDISLEKHGAFYHPLKISVTLSNGSTCRFVVNGAVSNPGIQLIESEFNLICRLNQTVSHSFLPRVFMQEIIETPKGNIGFFLGEWFENYHEFHITDTPDGQKVGLWLETGDILPIDDMDAVTIYRSAAKILTHYYSLDTWEQIYPWHHAAGDFVVKPLDNGFDVKLITVRGYAALIEIEGDSFPGNEMMVAGLLHFFLNLTLRMRLDKMDGTGKNIWLSDLFIFGAVDGFLEALDEKSSQAGIPDLKYSFLSFSSGLDQDQLHQILLNILDSYNRSSSEIFLLRDHLMAHCQILHDYLKNKAAK